MSNTILLIALIVCLFLLVSMSIVSYRFCNFWRKKFEAERRKKEFFKTENLKLQHEIFRANYIVPDVENKKGRKNNGSK